MKSSNGMLLFGMLISVLNLPIVGVTSSSSHFGVSIVPLILIISFIYALSVAYKFAQWLRSEPLSYGFYLDRSFIGIFLPLVFIVNFAVFSILEVVPIRFAMSLLRSYKVPDWVYEGIYIAPIVITVVLLPFFTIRYFLALSSARRELLGEQGKAEQVVEGNADCSPRD